MKRLLILTLIVAFAISSHSQTTGTLSKTLELKMPGDLGYNGASVAWNPAQKKYYACFAGNITYPMAIFDAKGKQLSDDTLTTRFDVRGLWYNPGTKTIQANGYADFGWVEYKTDSKGMITGTKTVQSGKKQPGDHCPGSFDPKKNAVYFLNSEGNIDVYAYKTAAYSSEITLHFSEASGSSASGSQTAGDIVEESGGFEKYNANTAVFTGISKAEIGLLNQSERKIDLFDMNTGKLTREYKLPGDASVSSSLNFAYSNGIFWLFDKEERTWVGYK